ncbi:AMP-activated serine/threonine-protein kinase regulatory subunit [Asimina triloba]
MFAPRPGSPLPPESSVGAGGVLVPTQFVWPYGGRRVFLTGSFTRWTEHLPMSPVEGCPTVFQVICSLPPGIHQYKFYVDGEWKHDESQPYVTGTYGIVNTILLTTAPIPAVLTPDSPAPRSHMDVDNYAIQRVEAVPRISEADIEISRHRISVFLSSHTAYELLPESGKVIALDINLPVKQAFHILYEQGIPLAPLWDSYKGQFVGVLSAVDFILILKELGNHGSNLTEEELETHTIIAWKEGKFQFNRQFGGHSGQFQRRLIHGGPYDSLKDVAVKILQNRVSTVPIIHSSSQDGSLPELLHLASLSGILKCKPYSGHANFYPYDIALMLDILISRSSGHYFIWSYAPPRDLSHDMTSNMINSNLFGLMLSILAPRVFVVVETPVASICMSSQVSSIPIVDENDSLLDIYSRSDITALAKDRVYAQVHLDEMSIQQALQLGQDAAAPYGFFNGQRCQMCLPTDTLQKVMERLANPGVRRLVIVEAGSKRVEGIISLSDIFKFLLS